MTYICLCIAKISRSDILSDWKILCFVIFFFYQWAVKLDAETVWNLHSKKYSPESLRDVFNNIFEIHETKNKNLNLQILWIYASTFCRNSIVNHTSENLE